MPDEPQSFLEKQPSIRGQKLAALIFLLWLPLAILVLGISALVEVNLILLGVFAVGTIFSLGLGIAALKAS
jgi:hypothetical protein